MNLECLEVSDSELPVSDIFAHHSVSGGIYEYCNESIIIISSCI